MKKVAVLSLLASMFLLFSLLEISDCLPTNGSISVPYSTNIPNIDGQSSTVTEWNDASENKMTNEFGWTAYLRLKHNETHIFAILDFVSDQSDSFEDNAIFAFDTNDEGGNIVRSDDYEFSFYYRLFAFYKGEVSQGSGLTPSSWIGISQPSGFIMQRGFSNLRDPYESEEFHSLYEAAFPRSLLSPKSNLGFYAYVNDSKSGDVLEFPAGASSTSPGEWGDIVMKTVLISPSPSLTQHPTLSPSPSIPEFPAFTVISLMMVAMLAGLAINRRKLNKQ
jgi:hypothetical protein